MNEREFYKLCYDRYKHEQNQADYIYQRAGILLPSLPLLGAVAYKLGQSKLLTQTFTRVDTFVYVLATTGAFACLSVSVVFLILCIYPRRYESLPPMKQWENWRKDYRKKLAGSGEEPDEEKIGKRCLAFMKDKVVDAENDYCRLNEIRRKHFRRAILWAALAIGAIAVQALFHMLLHVQGIS